MKSILFKVDASLSVDGIVIATRIRARANEKEEDHRQNERTFRIIARTAIYFTRSLPHYTTEVVYHEQRRRTDPPGLRHSLSLSLFCLSVRERAVTICSRLRAPT